MVITGIVLFLIFGGGITGAVQNAMRRHHKHRLDIIAAKAELAQSKNAALRPPPDPQPVCGCTHHLAKHDRSGKCHETVEAPTAWDAERKPLQYEARPCNCQQYIGPEPLGMVFAQDIVDPEGKKSNPEGKK